MKTNLRRVTGSALLSIAAMLASGAAAAFGSGGTGADGALNPTADTVLPLPPSGTFNFTTVNIPAGVTVTFQRNVTNRPVVMLATGDVIIAGTIDVSGSSSVGNTLFGNDGQPGLGGPGGYNGGQGGLVLGSRRGGDGLGPGGGSAGAVNPNNGSEGMGGGGGGYAAPGGAVSGTSSNGTNWSIPGGPSYGSIFIQPLIGGSGGGGGGGSATIRGEGGGGGGGAILIASSGAIELRATGRILANGGNTGTNVSTTFSPGCGAGGSGGAIRIVANAVRGNGLLQAAGGLGASSNCLGNGIGAPGRIRIEADQIPYANASNSPVPTADVPNPLFLAGQPNLRIASVGGVAAPAFPTGNMDVTLPTNVTNPVAVVFETSGVPVGSTISLVVTPSLAAPITAQSTPLSGTTTSATATASVSIPAGHSVFQATVTYAIVVALGEALSRYAQNERVEKITLSATLGGPSKAKLITVSGKEYDAPAEALRMAALGG